MVECRTGFDPWSGKSVSSIFSPVNLPVISKIYERSINEQLTSCFNQHFNICLSAFRPGYDSLDHFRDMKKDSQME